MQSLPFNTEQEQEKYWQRVNAESSRFARLEYRRRLAVRLAAELTSTTAIDNHICARLIAVLDAYASEVSILTDLPIQPDEYDGVRMIEVTKAHIEALILRRDVLLRYPRLQRYSLTITPTSPDIAVRVFYILDEAVNQFRETGAHFAGMLDVDDFENNEVSA
jgi:hypothetical protein